MFHKIIDDLGFKTNYIKLYPNAYTITLKHILKRYFFKYSAKIFLMGSVGTV